ncbi:MAG: hypothetical protein SCH68_12690, partial [Brevefilum sp.]|nr:hypothetical protein [Brevefilum sp.]
MKSINKKCFSFILASLLVYQFMVGGISAPVSAAQPDFKPENANYEDSTISLDQTDTNFNEDAPDVQLFSVDDSGLSFIVDVPWELLNLETIT